METRKFTQFGTFSVLIMLPLLLLFAGMFVWSVLTRDGEVYIHLFFTLLTLVCFLTFYQLTITVDATSLSFQLGIGLFKRKYELSAIKACNPVSNSILSGIGIRLLPNGWLYNVSGLKAIELQFHHKASIVRIGTDQPEEISRLVQSLLVRNPAWTAPAKNPTNRWIYVLWAAILLLVISVVVVPNYRDVRVQPDASGFTIKGVYGMTIPYPELEQVDTVAVLPAISLRTNGYAFGKTLTGNFKLADGSRAKLFVKKGSPPFIRIQSRDRVPVYINFEDKDQTLALFNRLRASK